jgi:RES domain
MNDLEGTQPPGRVMRIGRKPDPWAWPPWEAQHSDNTFGNRWDDPEGVYRVLYACTQLDGAYVEVLSRFRPDPAVLAGLAEITGADNDYRIGVVPTTWLETRVIGEATLTGMYADVGHARSLTYLRSVMAARLIHYNLVDVDAAAIRLTAPRRFTQGISNHIYKLSTPDGMPRFAGIEYESRFGDNYQNWAVFERPGHQPVTVRSFGRFTMTMQASTRRWRPSV